MSDADSRQDTRPAPAEPVKQDPPPPAPDSPPEPGNEADPPAKGGREEGSSNGGTSRSGRGGRRRGRRGRRKRKSRSSSHRGSRSATTSVGGTGTTPIPSETDFLKPGENLGEVDDSPVEDEKEAETEEPLRNRKILVNTMDSEESRVAVVNGRKLEELYINISSQSSYLGNIYKGRVVNVEPSIDAAFVDFGAARNGFLHASDVMPIYGTDNFKIADLAQAKAGEGEGPEALQAVVDEEEGGGETKEDPALRSRPRHSQRLPIQKLVKKGQEVVVQITKDGIGAKGPSLTTFISIPGRYLVLMPSLSRCGVSRKITDEKERRRLKKILEELGPPAGMGFIIRTAGTGRTKKELQKDLEYLLRLWEVFERRLHAGRAPQVMYEESDLVIKTMRDVFTPSVSEVLVDNEPVYRRILDFVSRIMPRYKSRIKMYTAAVPLFHKFNIETELEKLFQRKISLPSGGSIVIDQTEALVAIDINSGKYRREADLEETAFRTNLEAIPEIVRQIRLRDLGGVIVCDFIDMIESKHRREVERSFRDAMRDDRARVKMARLSPFGILEMTRQRMGPGLKRTLFGTCGQCAGTGMVKTPEATSLAVLREVQAVIGRRGFSTVEVTVHSDVEHYLSNVKRKNLLGLEERFQRNVILIGDPNLKSYELKLRFLTRDGREVKVH